MKTIKIIFILSFLITISSCKKAEAPAEEMLPVSTFDSPFPKKNKKLSNILGNVLTIKNGNDTLTLTITSTKNNNLIIILKQEILYFLDQFASIEIFTILTKNGMTARII